VGNLHALVHLQSKEPLSCDQQNDHQQLYSWKSKISFGSHVQFYLLGAHEQEYDLQPTLWAPVSAAVSLQWREPAQRSVAQVRQAPLQLSSGRTVMKPHSFSIVYRKHIVRDNALCLLFLQNETV
jgi:hypothetical protein